MWSIPLLLIFEIGKSMTRYLPRKEKAPIGRYCCIPSTLIWVPEDVTIPNALAILFYPLYTFGHEFDIFTVWTAHNSILADFDIVGNKSTLYNGTSFNFYARHQHTVNDLCAFSDFASGEQHGMFDFTLYNTALCDECFVNPGV